MKRLLQLVTILPLFFLGACTYITEPVATQSTQSAQSDTSTKFVLSLPDSLQIFRTVGQPIVNYVKIKAPATANLGFDQINVSMERGVMGISGLSLGKGADPSCNPSSPCATAIYTLGIYGVATIPGGDRVTISMVGDPKNSVSFLIFVNDGGKG